jgi:hypothetical protein
LESAILENNESQMISDKLYKSNIRLFEEIAKNHQLEEQVKVFTQRID